MVFCQGQALGFVDSSCQAQAVSSGNQARLCACSLVAGFAARGRAPALQAQATKGDAHPYFPTGSCQGDVARRGAAHSQDELRRQVHSLVLTRTHGCGDQTGFCENTPSRFTAKQPQTENANPDTPKVLRRGTPIPILMACAFQPLHLHLILELPFRFVIENQRCRKPASQVAQGNARTGPWQNSPVETRGCRA